LHAVRTRSQINKAALSVAHSWAVGAVPMHMRSTAYLHAHTRMRFRAFYVPTRVCVLLSADLLTSPLYVLSCAFVCVCARAGIADLRDESDRDGVRVVIELKRDAVPQVRPHIHTLTSIQSICIYCVYIHTVTCHIELKRDAVPQVRRTFT
jgi:hypothetical protein